MIDESTTQCHEKVTQACRKSPLVASGQPYSYNICKNTAQIASQSQVFFLYHSVQQAEKQLNLFHISLNSGPVTFHEILRHQLCWLV